MRNTHITDASIAKALAVLEASGMPADTKEALRHFLRHEANDALGFIADWHELRTTEDTVNFMVLIQAGYSRGFIAGKAAVAVVPPGTIVH